MFQVQGNVVRAHGIPGEQIIQKSDELGVTMIIIASRGLGKIRRTILGSVSDYVVHHSSVPVIVCRHWKIYAQTTRIGRNFIKSALIDVHEHYINKMELYKSALKDLRNKLYKNGKELYKPVQNRQTFMKSSCFNLNILMRQKCPQDYCYAVFISFFPNNNHKKIFCLELTSTEKCIFLKF